MRELVDELTVSIYALINPINNWVFYIGASMYPEKRLLSHIYNSKYNYSEKEKIISDIISKGQSVEMLILEECKFKDVTFLENFYLDLFKSYGFNLTQSRYSNYCSSQFTRIDISDKKQISFSIDTAAYNALLAMEDCGAVNRRELIEYAIMRRLKQLINHDRGRFEFISNKILGLNINDL